MFRGRSSRLRAREAYHETQDENIPPFPDVCSGVRKSRGLSPHAVQCAKAEEVSKAMQEQDGNKQFNISERLEDLRREHEALRWEGSFRDYFELVAQNPRIAQLSHARINDMVHAAGIERLNEGTQHEVLSYKFFDAELFGIEEPIARIVEYFKSAAQRLEVRKRILLLMGP